MATSVAISNGIKVSAEAFFQLDLSAPKNNKYVFAYKILIENTSTNTVQLLSRRWHIYDSNGLIRTVEGDGVIGRQPILKPNELYEYVSGSDLTTEIGKMDGYYFFVNLDTKTLFEVEIPSFLLAPNYKMN